MCSNSEIQKCYLATSSATTNLTEMLPELFDAKIVLPPAPKPSIFKSIFSNTPVDREELCKLGATSFFQAVILTTGPICAY